MGDCARFLKLIAMNQQDKEQILEWIDKHSFRSDDVPLVDKAVNATNLINFIESMLPGCEIIELTPHEVIPKATIGMGHLFISKMTYGIYDEIEAIPMDRDDMIRLFTLNAEERLSLDYGYTVDITDRYHEIIGLK